MALRQFNLDITSTDKLMVLVYGPYGSGKTHLQGDFLRWARDKGPVAFLNVITEDGTASVAGMGLGNIGYTAECIADYEEALGVVKKAGCVGLAVDSLSAFYKLMLKKIVGDVRYPDPKVDGEKAKMMWGQLIMQTENLVTLSRYAAPYVLWVSPYDKSEDPVEGSERMVTPNIPGKLAHGCAGWFDFVGYLKAMAMGPGRVDRKLTLAPGGKVLTKQRLAEEITTDIPVPKGGGGWANFMGAVQKAMVGTPAK